MYLQTLGGGKTFFITFFECTKWMCPLISLQSTVTQLSPILLPEATLTRHQLIHGLGHMGRRASSAGHFEQLVGSRRPLVASKARH